MSPPAETLYQFPLTPSISSFSPSEVTRTMAVSVPGPERRFTSVAETLPAALSASSAEKSRYSALM